MSRNSTVHGQCSQEPNGVKQEDVKQEDGMLVQNVEYVSEQLEADGSAMEAFSDVFARFQLPPESPTVRKSLLRVLVAAQAAST